MVAIRRLGLADVAMVEELLDLVEPDWRDALAPGASGPLAFVADPDTFMFGAYVDHDPAAWLWGVHVRRPDGQVMTYVHELDVAEPHRRLGIATLLVEAAEAEARQAGAHELWLITRADNKPGQALYGSTGGSYDGRPFRRYTWSLN